MIKIIASFFMLLSIANSAFAEELGRETGMPIPRFVSLKSAEINMRKGPGTRYPIEWVYRRDRLPVEIIQEFELWRQIRDMDGATGWLHKNMLSGTRTILVTSKEPVMLKAESESDAKTIAQLKSGVIALLKECKKDWCEVEVKEHEGWLPKKSFYGAYDKELYNP